jgi:alpha-N-arabinofuranosidase
MDAIHASASRDTLGRIHFTLVNIDPKKEQALEIELRGASVRTVSGKALTSARLTDHNTFSDPDAVSVKEFKGSRLSGGKLSVTLPAKSVVMLEME